MHDLNSEIWLDARADFGWMRARARAACPAAGPAADFTRALAAERAPCGQKPDALIVFLSEFWV